MPSSLVPSRLLRKLFLKDRWFLILRGRDGGSWPGDSRVLLPPRDRFYADPFLLKVRGVTYLFFEDYRYRQAKGVIGCIVLDASGQTLSSVTVLERPYHLSFPFVFEWSGEFWMVPETSANRTVELYRARSFPGEWVFEKDLLISINASDTILHYGSSQWWLFTLVESGRGYRYEDLFLYSADSPLSEWRPHPLNPVVKDASRARPAGRIFERAGALLRPGQDCSNGYGRAIQMNEIVALTDTTYEERTVSRIEPEWPKGSRGTHTYNFSEDFEVFDGYTVSIDLYAKWLSFQGSLNRLLQKQ